MQLVSDISDKNLISRLFYSIYKIRWVEKQIAEIYPTDVIKSPVHLSIGQEAVSVGVCDALETDDVVFGTYRGHALYLAKGGDLNAMMAELYGKIDGCCRGKGGSMHLIDTSVNMMGTSAIVASSIPQAVGYAMSLKYKKSRQVVVCFFGDGATNEGVFHESINFASLKQLPILFVCENNNYAIHSPIKDRSVQPNLYKLAEANKIPSYVLQEDNVIELRGLVLKLVKDMRSGSGPQFIEAYTHRWLEHVGPDEDWHLNYRSPEEIASWKINDQLDILGDMLSFNNKIAIENEVKAETRDAMKFAAQSSFPDKSELDRHVYR